MGKSRLKIITILGILLLSFIIIFNIIARISRLPYQDKHLLEQYLSFIEVSIEDKAIKGSLYVAYWIKISSEETNNMSREEIERYVAEKGKIDLEKVREEVEEVLSNYTLEDLKNRCYTDKELFSSHSHWLNNDERLQEILVNRISLDYPLEFKKVFFVYMNGLE